MSDKITLQVNANGAWKNVADFDASHRAEVTAAVDFLATALGSGAWWDAVSRSDMDKKIDAAREAQP